MCMKLKLSAPPQIKIAFAPFIPFVDVRQLLSPKVKGAHVFSEVFSPFLFVFVWHHPSLNCGGVSHGSAKLR